MKELPAMFIALIMGGVGGSLMGYSYLALTEPHEMTCTDARIETMAMRECLRHRPQCEIKDGILAFKLYHEALEVADRCLTEGIRE